MIVRSQTPKMSGLWPCVEGPGSAQLERISDLIDWKPLAELAA